MMLDPGGDASTRGRFAVSDRRAPQLAWSLFASFVALAGATVSLGSSDDIFVALLIGFALIGALIASRRSENPIGWILLAIALSFTLSAFGEAYVGSASAPGLELVGVMAGSIWYAWLFLAAIILPLLFPNGHLVSARWRPVLWLGVAALILSVLGSALKPGPLDLDSAEPIRNPLGVGGAGADVVAVMASLGDALIGVALVLAGASVVVRLRRARGAERQQLKWFAYVGVMALVGLVMAMVQVISGSGSGMVNAVGAIGWFSALFLIIIGIPVATGVAILRYRLYDIDVVINRTLVYGALTATLAAAYLGTVLLLQLVLSGLTEDSGLAVAGSTLAVAALFRPARSRIQAAVDRRFFRRKYDAARTLERFGARLRDEVALDSLSAELRGVVADTMQPAHVSLWLRTPESGR